MKQKISESQLQSQILQYLRYKGFLCWKNHNTGIYDPHKKYFRKIGKDLVGIPDISFIYPRKSIGGDIIGQHGFIEVKIKPNKPSKAQDNWIQKAIENNCIAFVAYTIDDVINFIEEKE